MYINKQNDNNDNVSLSSNESNDLLEDTVKSNVDAKKDESLIKTQNDKIVTTRFGRNVSGGRGSEYVCQCNGKVRVCNKDNFHSIANLRKCRNCNAYVLTNHLSKYWTCGKCIIVDD